MPEVAEAWASAAHRTVFVEPDAEPVLAGVACRRPVRRGPAVAAEGDGRFNAGVLPAWRCAPCRSEAAAGIRPAERSGLGKSDCAPSPELLLLFASPLVLTLAEDSVCFCMMAPAVPPAHAGSDSEPAGSLTQLLD